jgi:hypothetical protein
MAMMISFSESSSSRICISSSSLRAFPLFSRRVVLRPSLADVFGRFKETLLSTGSAGVGVSCATEPRGKEELPCGKEEFARAYFASLVLLRVFLAPKTEGWNADDEDEDLVVADCWLVERFLDEDKEIPCWTFLGRLYAGLGMLMLS